MQFNGSGVVCLSGFDGGFKMSDEYGFPFNLYSGFIWIFSPIRSKANALKSRLAIRMRAPIHSILRACGESHVFFPAIKTVSVLMVNSFRWESHNESVKRNFFSSPSALRDLGHSVKIMSAFCGVPFESANKVRIFIVDQCRLALSQFDMFHIRIVPNFSVKETTPTGTKNRRKTVAKEASGAFPERSFSMVRVT
jgi:hypothetical protein